MSRVEVVVQPDDRTDLYGVTWRLTGIDDATTALVATATGVHALRFRHTTLFRGPGERVPVTRAGDNFGSHSRVVIERDRMQFGQWVNGLVGGYSAARVSSRPGSPTGRLTTEEYRLVLSVLTGTASWSVHDNTLTLSKPGIASLTFVADAGE